MANRNILEPHPKLIPIRLSCFETKFWQGWEQINDGQKETYILRWLAKLEHELFRIRRGLNKLKHVTGGSNHEASDCRHQG
jgi:hypothetical protein